MARKKTIVNKILGAAGISGKRTKKIAGIPVYTESDIPIGVEEYYQGKKLTYKAFKKRAFDMHINPTEILGYYRRYLDWYKGSPKYRGYKRFV